MAKRNHYWNIPCHICGANVSNNGGAYAAHIKAHVRKGEARPVNKYGAIIYVKTPAEAGNP
jgi:hypothetical protein